MKIETVEGKTTKPWFKADSRWPMWIRRLEYMIRVHIFRQPRYLIAVWKLDTLEELQIEHGCDIEAELVNALTAEIQKEIKENGSYTWEELCDMDKNKCP